MPIPQRLTRVKPGFNSGFARLFGKGYTLNLRKENVAVLGMELWTSRMSCKHPNQWTTESGEAQTHNETRGIYYSIILQDGFLVFHWTVSRRV